MRKLFAIILSGALLMMAIPLSSATVSTDTFSDLDSDDPSYDAIVWMEENGIVQGYDDGTFQSLNKINRAEFMKIVVESITDDAEGSSCFPDVTDEWFAKYVCYGKDTGLIDGYDDGYFRPANEINFAEASKIVAGALELDLAEVGSDDPWYRAYVEPLADEGAIPTSISDLDKSIARGEMAEVIYRVEEDVEEKESLSYQELEGELVPVESCAALKDTFLDEPEEYWYWYEDDEDSAEVESADSSGESASGSSSGESSEEYSSTNTQVAGVDEADIIKNDGEYIYMIKDDYTVRIIDAYPADEMNEVATIDWDNDEDSFYPSEMYLDGDQLTVIGSIYNYTPYYYDWAEDEDTYLDYFHEDRTGVYIYNIEDHENPELLRKLEFDGDYDDSRKVDDTLYVVMNKFDLSYYYYDFELDDLNVEEVLPRYYDSSTGNEEYMVGCTDISYLPYERDLNYLITVAIPLDDLDGEVDKEVIIGESEVVYSSRANMYIASTNYDYNDYYYDWSNAKTLVHRFALGNDTINHEDSGKVPGTILDQFSLDEYDDHLRIATTEGSWWSSDAPENNFYVLDMDLDIVGSIEGIAPNEMIYSTRFTGETGYIVTFEKVDPLFVLDLSNPENPYITGELKVPGYSDYLHPWTENYLFGFGKDAEDASEEEEAARDLDFSWYQGMKVSLFDVSNMENPFQIDSEGIGDRGTYSELLYDHKALMFDDDLQIMAFPVTVALVTDENASANTSGDYVYQGAYVYTFDSTDINLLGTITHYPDDYDWDDYYYYWSADDYDIERIIYIGDNLYTISDGKIMANDMETLDEVNSVELE